MRGEMTPKRYLFVCVENACRSQMAEAFARALGGGAVEAWSAGSAPGERVHPEAVRSMRELGIRLAGHRAKSVDEVPDGPYDAVVTMGCGDACPSVPARRRVDWELRDPAGLPPAEFRAVRDEIGRRVRGLLEEDGVPPRPRAEDAAGLRPRGSGEDGS